MSKENKVSQNDVDSAMMDAIMSTVGSMNLKDMFKMLNSRMSFDASFEGMPLKIDLKVKEGEILARIKVIEENDTEEKANGDQSETN